MKCAIMQPTFFPWAGYFSIINEVDKFIFLDDAQFSKGSWHNRNKIFSKNKTCWLTLPLKKTKLSTSINRIEVANKNYLKNEISNQIEDAYKQHEYFSCVSEIISFIKSLNNNRLSDINISIIKFLSLKLRIDQTQFIKSSDLKVNGKRTSKIINILNKVSASHYISPPSSKDYLTQDQYELNTNIPISFMNYNLKNYLQKKNLSFVSNLSIIDVIANIGWANASNYVKNN